MSYVSSRVGKDILSEMVEMGFYRQRIWPSTAESKCILRQTIGGNLPPLIEVEVYASIEEGLLPMPIPILKVQDEEMNIRSVYATTIFTPKQIMEEGITPLPMREARRLMRIAYPGGFVVATGSPDDAKGLFRSRIADRTHITDGYGEKLYESNIYHVSPTGVLYNKGKAISTLLNQEHARKFLQKLNEGRAKPLDIDQIIVMGRERKPLVDAIWDFMVERQRLVSEGKAR